MKKNNVLSKILCVFKPKKMPCDIVTEAENIINQYISNDGFYPDIQDKSQKRTYFLNFIIIAVLAAVGYIALRALM
ncbi:MAG: hypothetical protein IJ460_05190 [Clostridia bacterium]|nr:hypothetical protein [Clostridia bacterium]